MNNTTLLESSEKAPAAIVEKANAVNIDVLAMAALQHVQSERMGVWEIIKARFCLGVMTCEVLKDKQNGDSNISKLAAKMSEKLGYPFYHQRLYEAARVVKHFAEDPDNPKNEDVENIRKLDNKDQVNWTFLVKNCVANVIHSKNSISPKESQVFLEKHMDSLANLGKNLEEHQKIQEKILASPDISDEDKQKVIDAAASVAAVVPDIKTRNMDLVIDKLNQIFNIIDAGTLTDLPQNKKTKYYMALDKIVGKINWLKESLIGQQGPIADVDATISAAGEQGAKASEEEEG